MQEQINEKSVSLIIKGTKLTSTILAKSIKKMLIEMKKQKQPKLYQGKQSVKNLVRQGVGVSNIEITDNNIKSFEKTARKYGIDFALKKDKTVSPRKWLVFFKARDADALTAAFKEYSTETLKKSARKSRPSVISLIKKMKTLSQSLYNDKVKNKNKERER